MSTSQLTFREWRHILLLLAPLLGFVSLFIIIPIAGTIWTSFFQEVAFMPRHFIGIENYEKLMQDKGFWQSLRFTLLFIAISVPLEIVLGLMFALVLNEAIPFRGLLRTAILIPWAIPAAIAGRTWELIYNYHYGLANFLVNSLHLSPEPINWLGTSTGAFFSLVIADAWKTSPFVAIIILAGLQTIPPDLYLQARVDRANLFQRFLYITLPQLKPVLLVALLFRTIDALRIFDLIYVLTHGGPGGATTSLSLYGFQYLLMSDFGYGSAISVVLFLIAFLLSILYVHAGKFQEAVS